MGVPNSQVSLYMCLTQYRDIGFGGGHPYGVGGGTAVLASLVWHHVAYLKFQHTELRVEVCVLAVFMSL